jgi:hypothetical protein
VNQLRQLMLEELRRRNFADTTIRSYLHGVEHFSRYFRRRHDQLGISVQQPAPSMPSRSLRKEDTSTADEPASAGDGRHCSLCGTVFYRTQSQVDQLATPKSVAARSAISQAPARCPMATLHSSIPSTKRQFTPINAASLNLPTRSSPFKVHSLP